MRSIEYVVINDEIERIWSPAINRGSRARAKRACVRCRRHHRRFIHETTRKENRFEFVVLPAACGSC
jgi:hypothetical protein